MQSNWLDVTLHLSLERLRCFNWVEADMLPEEEILDLTNDEERDIMAIRECEYERD